ncbi:MAG: sulfite exporter TauE/SafE family protein [Phycisphaerales bacterium]
MDYLLVCTVALLAAGLTLISGFGLGTLLMPAFAVFFPPEVAIGATAVAHLANSLFKLALIGRWADRALILAFGLPAIAGAVLGAALLAGVATLPAIATYTLGPIDARITPVALAIGTLIIAFAFLESSERFAAITVPKRAMPWGGLLSGFFGGLSGHQGALRSIFLVKSGTDPKRFAGTSATIAAMVDIARLAIYAAGAAFFTKDLAPAAGVPWPLVAAACLAAFAGSALGAQLVRKVTMHHVRRTVAVLLAILGTAMIAGVI